MCVFVCVHSLWAAAKSNIDKTTGIKKKTNPEQRLFLRAQPSYSDSFSLPFLSEGLGWVGVRGSCCCISLFQHITKRGGNGFRKEQICTLHHLIFVKIFISNKEYTVRHKKS